MRVPAVCAAPKTMEKPAALHGPIRPPHTVGCESHRRLVRIVPPIYGLWHCFTHTSCICNDTIACVNRVIGEVPAATARGVRMLRKALREVWRDRVLTPLSLEGSLASFKGAKRRIYQRAYDSLRVEPLSRKDARIKAFVKAEKFNPKEKVNPDPRMIQARDPRYNLHLARFLRPLEHVVYGVRSPSGLPMIVKCMNPKQRAALILEKWRLFDNPVCVSLDCSRWDKHVGPDVLKVEHDFYRSWFPGDQDLDQLLRWQMVNECRTSNGLRYQVVGGRMSGDMNTALGNCTLMVGMAHAAMKQLRVKQYDFHGF